MNETGAGMDRMRVDVWLWRIRFFKTRSLAAHMVERSGLRIERDGQVRRIDKPSTTVAAGDLVSFAVESGAFVLRVVSLPHRRGPATEAAQCYEALNAPARDRDRARD